MENLAERVFEVLNYYDPYTVKDMGATADTCRNDIEKTPEVVIDYLLNIIKDLQEGKN